MKNNDDIDNIDWSDYDTAYGAAVTIPEMIKKLLTSNKKDFDGTMLALYHHLCHQGTIYEGTVKSIPFFWKVFQYHIDKNQFEFARDIIRYLKDIYTPDDWFIEPFGFDLTDMMKKTPDNIFIDMIEEIVKQWDLILEFFTSDSEWLKNQAVFFLRYNLLEAEGSIEKLREAIPKERNEIILVNMLEALALLEAHLGISSDLQIFYNFLHPDYPWTVRLVALLGFFILKKGDVPNSLAQLVIDFIGNIENKHYTFHFTHEPDLDGLKMDFPENDRLEVFKDTTSNSSVKDYHVCLFENKNVLYFVRPGANKLLFPILLDIFDEIPDHMEKPELASINVTETLLTLLFPNGCIRALNSLEKLTEDQINFIRKLIDTKKWEYTSFSMLLNENGMGKSKEEFIKHLSDSPHMHDFNDILILQKIKSESKVVQYKLDQEGYLKELNAEYLPEKLISEVIGDLKHLKKLKLRPGASNEYLGFSEKLKTLETLELYLHKIKDFPSFVEKLPALKSLSIESYDEDEFPPSLKNLTSLEKLILTLHHHKTLPYFLEKLFSLTSLEIRIKEIEILPDIFESLNNLEYLNLQSLDNLKTLPNSLCKLSKLIELIIGGGPFPIRGGLDALPSCIGNLVNLEKLSVNIRNGKSLPDSFGELKNLTSFKCCLSALESLPDSFGMLKKLKFLEIAGCNITSLPESIGQMNALEKIIVTGTKITKLPKSIVNLKNLKEIYVHDNQILELPLQLPDIEQFLFKGNPVEKDAEKTIEFFKILVEKKLLEVKDFYKSNPENWINVYEDIKKLLRNKSISIVGFAAVAQFYLLEGAKLNDLRMISDSMGRFADAMKTHSNATKMYPQYTIKHLYQGFKEGELFKPAYKYLTTHHIRAEAFLNEFSKNTFKISQNNEEANKVLFELNDQAWFYLMEGFNLQFSLACGQFMSIYGLDKSLHQWECYGKDLIASVKVLKGGLDNIKEAINLFEEIREINEEWYSPTMLQLAIDKLEELE